MMIENKIYSGEGKGQLRKYRNIIETSYPDYKHKIYIYLSLEDQNINDQDSKHYVQLNYGHISKLIEQKILK
ncbi:PD-(D/E)XK nuclease family protein [Acinetobacter sp. YH01003]|nr:PD-(D/E)XK nuclease family protein [Acinetobacter sp. YH01003]